MKRPVNSPGWEERRLAERESSHLWRSILKAIGVLMFLLIVGVGLVGLKFMRKLSKHIERQEISMQRLDSLHNSWDRSIATTTEDSLEKIDLQNATVTGRRDLEMIEIPFVSDRAELESLLGRADSVTADHCSRKSRLHYRSSIIEIDSGVDDPVDRSCRESRIQA
jgi:hypothetical protein